MSDTTDEIRDHLGPIRKAERWGGTCLVNGMGLGMVAAAMLEGGAKRVIAVDKAPEVMELVGLPLQSTYGDRIVLVEADALDYKPPKGERYAVVWHDIWEAISGDNLPEMLRLHRKYGRRCDWQGSWCRALAENQERQWKRQRAYWG